MQYTVQIHGDDDVRGHWEAPAENVADSGSPEQGALDAVDDQTVIDLDQPWQVHVWAGADADTTTEPVHVLDDVAFADLQADALDEWEAGRAAAEAEYEERIR
jgi:hypothetical protein